MASPADPFTPHGQGVLHAEAVRSYHERSKHGLDRYAPGPGYLDWANQPDPFRGYAGAARISPPLLADALVTPFAAMSRGAMPAASELSLEPVATLLELSLGLSAWKSFGGARWALRCNPSSGNLHPTEGYVVCPDLPGLERGVYHYVSRDHALERRATPDASPWAAAFPPGGVIIGLTSIHWREAWKYGMRAFRYCQHDAGHAMAAIAYAAAALGWRVRRLDDWGDADIAALLGLDRSEDFADAEQEAPDLLLWVGAAEARAAPHALLDSLAHATWSGQANRLSTQHMEWPDIPRVHAAVLKPRTPPADAGAPPRPPLAPSASLLSAATLIRQRRSGVDFDGVTRIGAATFFTMMDALLPRQWLPPWGALASEPRVHAALFVHRVDGLAPGLYLLVRDEPALADLRGALNPDFLWQKTGSAHLPLYLLVAHDLRAHARRVCCHQDVAADSCFSLGFLARFRDVVDREPWRYRELFRETGLLGQVLYLEAEAAGVRGTGIGCFFDDEMHRLLGLADDRFQSLYHFTVGGPVDDPRLTTLAPYGER